MIHGTEIARGFDTFRLLPERDIVVRGRDRRRLRGAPPPSSTPSYSPSSSLRQASPSSGPTTTSGSARARLAGGRATAVATLIDRAEGLYDSGRARAGEAVLTAATNVLRGLPGNENLTNALNDLKANPPG